MASMYFIAIVAPGYINHDVLKWKLIMKERYGCEVALRSPAHITLIPPFWMEDALENNLKLATDDYTGKRACFEIELKNFGCFKPRVIYADVVPTGALRGFQTELVDFLVGKALFPIRKDDHSFHPHITIATRDLRKKSFYEAWAIFEKKEYNVRWTACGVSLLKHDQKNWAVIYTSQLKEDNLTT